MGEVEPVARETHVPTDYRQLRACMICGLLKTFSQFEETGCENCTFLAMQEDKDRILDCTSGSFDGVISMCDAAESWVARWQRLPSHYIPGCYAISVNGILASHIVSMCAENQIQYVSRQKAC